MKVVEQPRVSKESKVKYWVVRQVLNHQLMESAKDLPGIVQRVFDEMRLALVEKGVDLDQVETWARAGAGNTWVGMRGPGWGN